VPENLWGSRLRGKLSDVADLNFQGLLDDIPDLEKVLGPLEKFDPKENDDFSVLYEAVRVDLPKGYGRD